MYEEYTPSEEDFKLFEEEKELDGPEDFLEDLDGLTIKSTDKVNGLILNEYSIVYKCPKCDTIFHGVPTDKCMFCNTKFNLKETNEKEIEKETDNTEFTDQGCSETTLA